MFVRAVEESVKYTLCTVPRVACSDLAPSLDLPLLAVFVEKKLKTRLEIYYS